MSGQYSVGYVVPLIACVTANNRTRVIPQLTRVASFPAEAPALECPYCGYMNAVPPKPDAVSE